MTRRLLPARLTLLAALAVLAALLAGACAPGYEPAYPAHAELLGRWSLTRDALDSDAELLGVVASSFDVEIDSADVSWAFHPDGTFHAWGPARATTTAVTAGLRAHPRSRRTTYERVGTYDVAGDVLTLHETVTGDDGAAREVTSAFRMDGSRAGEYLLLTAEHHGDDVRAPLRATGLDEDDLVLMGIYQETSQLIVLERAGATVARAL